MKRLLKIISVLLTVCILLTGMTVSANAYATSWAWKYAAGAALTDGPVPAGDVIGGIIMIGAVGWDAGTTVSGWIKQADSRYPELKGTPGEVKVNGDTETTIGSDGRAVRVRHKTDHGNPKHHSNPHDHDINWRWDGTPEFGPAINYW